MSRRMPSHATVVAYLALFVALGGSAYAITRIDSGDVLNNSLKSKDLKDGKAVAGRDVRQDTLTGEQIREGRLDASQFSEIASGGGGCDPSEEATTCGAATVSLPTSGKIFAIASGGFSSSAAPARLVCTLAFDGVGVTGISVGQDAPAHTNVVTSDSFSFSGVSPSLASGGHEVSLTCREGEGDARLSDVNISAVALGTG